MRAPRRKSQVTMVACMTLDGCIARAKGEAPNQEKYGGWTSREDKAVFWEEVGKAAIVMGGRVALNEMPRVRKPVALITRKVYESLTSSVSADLMWSVPPYQTEMRKFLDNRNGAKIALCGGAMTYDFMLRWNFVDRLVLVIEPIIMKRGVGMIRPPLFQGGQEDNKFILLGHRSLNHRGTLRLEFKRVNEWTR